MIYSRSAEYAIRALVHIAARGDGGYIMAKQIAEEASIPGHFLAKILQQLARQGLLRSSKGPTGGFALTQPPNEVSLKSIVEIVDGLGDYYRCQSGLAECSDEAPCGMHDAWKQCRGQIMQYLESRSIGDVALAQVQKRMALAKRDKRKKPAAK
ncbi:MAG: Rrf2 family transcriptional regulator [Bryobacteraceae bacterium]|nr:Rrf2 family transcriptional regulator [Bryobacteraceae bacterium]